MSAGAGMRHDKLALLASYTARLKLAAEHLSWSLERCRHLAPGPWGPEQLERLESLASRFARLSDLLTQRVMRLADELELETQGSLLDRIRRAEKRGWAETDGQLVRVRELRNLIAHEYEDEDLVRLYAEVQALSPALLATVAKALAWARGAS